MPTITIGENGVDLSDVRISVGQQVRFVNNGSSVHEIASDPHPFHTQCPAINAVGVLGPGGSRLTSPFTVPGTCGFHDHRDPFNDSVQGAIVIQWGR